MIPLLARLTYDPVWPSTYGPAFLPALGVAAVFLTVLTVWAYGGVARARRVRVFLITLLRLVALALACLLALRPALPQRVDPKEPSTLLIALDASESMTNRDVYGEQSRWHRARSLIREDCAAILRELREQYHITVVLYRFAEDVRELVDHDEADGPRTDFGEMLHTLFDRHAGDRNLRGLVIVSDGADNGARYPALGEADRWRQAGRSVNTFVLGKETTADHADLALTAIHAEPSPVFVKGKLSVKGVLDAPGFESAEVTTHLLIDGKEVAAGKQRLDRRSGNEIALSADAPDRPGEVKVTLKVDPLPGELSMKNNQIDTYVTITKEGVSVLLIDRPRFPEPQRIVDALTTDPRIRLYTAWRRTNQAGGEEEDPFGLARQHYDAIILGDVSPQRLTGGNPRVLEQIRDAVRAGTGLIMMGGYETFAEEAWRGTPLEDVLPSRFGVATAGESQIAEEVAIEPTREGLQHYVMGLVERSPENAAQWARLPKLNGMTRLEVKQTATVLAVRAGTREPVLAGQRYGEGRTLAFAGDTTWRWEKLGQPKSAEGVRAHQRFWKQVVLWLAKQEESAGSIWVKPALRRLPTGGRLEFTAGARGRGGVELKEGRYRATVTAPDGAQLRVPTVREDPADHGTFWKTDASGEYVLRVRGQARDGDGKEIAGEATARFLVYEDDAEASRRGADPKFLERLSQHGGGRFQGDAGRLPEFLRELKKQPLSAAGQHVEYWPDWGRHTLSGFVIAYLLAFVGVLSLEWFLRRRWGLV